MPDDRFCLYLDWLSGSFYFGCSSLASELCLCSECPWYIGDVSLF